MDHSIYGMLQVSEILKKRLQLLSNVNKRKSCPIPCLLTEIHITGYGSEICGVLRLWYISYLQQLSMATCPCSENYVSWLKVKSLSHVSLSETPWTVAYQAPPSMGFSRQEYLSGLPFPSPGDLSDPGIKPRFPALQVDAFTLWTTREAMYHKANLIAMGVEKVDIT